MNGVFDTKRRKLSSGFVELKIIRYKILYNQVVYLWLSIHTTKIINKIEITLNFHLLLSNF